MEKVVVITGATGGIGYALSKEYAMHKHHLVLVGRNETKLQEMKQQLESFENIHIYIITIDLAKLNAAQDIYHKFKELNLEIEILINNAGFGDYGLFLESDINHLKDMIQVNCTTLMELTYLFGNDMKANDCGTIINISSIGAFVPGALLAVYYASKAFVLSFTEAIATELSKTKVNVLAICPGPTKTAFFEKANATKSKILKNIKAVDPSIVARYTYRILQKKRVVGIVGFTNKLGVFALRFLPRNTIRNIVYRLQARRQK